MELAWVSIAEVAEKIDLPLAVGKELRIEFICVKGQRSVQDRAGPVLARIMKSGSMMISLG